MNNSTHDGFVDSYEFLHVSFKCDVVYQDTLYPSVGHALEAARFPDDAFAIRNEIKRAAFYAKARSVSDKYAKTVQIKSYEGMKGIAKQLIESKFSDPILAQKLIETNDTLLFNVEQNANGFWGVDKVERTGLNTWGELLMMYRDLLRAKRKWALK